MMDAAQRKRNLASAGDSYVFGYKLLLTSLFVVSGLR
jgi:hypothetical protein